MNNRGYITVFMTLITAMLLSLVIAVMNIVDMSNAEAQLAIAVNCAESDLKAGYDRYIFDNYHILLIDSNFDGRNEGYLEERAEENLRNNLGDGYSDINVTLTDKTYIMDNDCAELKKQINDHFIYGMSESVIDNILDNTKEENPLNDQVMEGIIDSADKESKEIEQKQSNDGKETKKSIDDKKTEDEDPRDSVKKYTDSDIASLLNPQGGSFHDYEVDKALMPSTNKKTFEDKIQVDRKFSDMNRFKDNALSGNGWMDGLKESAATLSYVSNTFNCFTDGEKSDKALNLEIEYLIAGKNNDKDNFIAVINKIIVIRMGFNYGYIITDVDKVTKMSALAWEICALTPLAQPAVKYLLLGCWAYIESVADAYSLVRGNKVAYLKNKTNWKTDLSALTHLSDFCSEDDCKGLSYKEYLLILLTFHLDESYYRMLDIMQMNVNLNEERNGNYLYMSDCITAFSLDVNANYKGRNIYISEDTGY